jgi:hypothetical protein
MAGNQFSISESLVVSAYAILRASLLTARSLFCRPEVPGGESQRLTDVAEGHELRKSQVRCGLRICFLMHTLVADFLPRRAITQ